MQLDREEIEAQLEELSKEQCVAFAVRSAMRVLPLLAAKKKADKKFGQKIVKHEAFYFWQSEDKAKHLLAIYRAYSSSLEFVLVGNSTRARAAAYAAADAAAYAYATVIIQESQQDLNLLKTLSARELLQQPLWSNAIPQKWQVLIDNFKQDALSLNAGFDIWLDWYDDRLAGKARQSIQNY